MKYIKKYFLFLFFFIFTLSIVDLTHTFSKTEGKRGSDIEGIVDVEACKKNIDLTKTGAERYSTTCKTQCTSTGEQYTQFKKDNSVICNLFGTPGSKEEIAKIVQNVVEKLNKADQSAVEAVVPDFTTQASKYEFKLTFNDQLRSALQEVIFAQPSDTTASYNILNDNTTPTKVVSGAAAKTEKIKERAAGAIKNIILESFGAAPIIKNNYNDKIIKKFRDNWLNVDLKGDTSTKEADFTVDNFKSTTPGTVGYSLPHELYQSDFDYTLTKPIDAAQANDDTVKSEFLKAYKDYISKNINIKMLSNTWENARSLEFQVSLNADAAQITLPATEAEFNAVIPSDLSTKEAFDKIKEVFDVTAERIPYSDLGNNFADDAAVIASIENTGLIPVRVTITPKNIVPDTKNKPITVLYDERLAKSRKVFNERITSFATTPTQLGSTPTTGPTAETLYHYIYTQAVTGLTLINIRDIITVASKAADPTSGSITAFPSKTNAIVNAKVIAVKKGDGDVNVSILLQLGGVATYISPFEKISGVKVSYAHIVNPTLNGLDFFNAANFKKGLASFKLNPTASECHPSNDSLIGIMVMYPACRNLLKIEVPSSTTIAEFGIVDGDDVGTVVGSSSMAISAIIRILDHIKKFTNYFNPTLGETEDHYLYTSETVRAQLASSRNVEGFIDSRIITHNFAATSAAQTNLALLPRVRNSVVCLLRANGDTRSVYLTKILSRSI